MLPKNLGDLLDASGKKYPKRVAIVFGQKKITYKTLQETTNHIAAGLIHLGIKKQDRVAILMDNSPEFVISYYSILKSGAIAVPINYMFKTEEINYILQDSQACSLITSRLHLETAQELRLRVESLKHIIAAGKTSLEKIVTFDQLKKNDPHCLLKNTPEENDLAVILYTSGTTGHPKGAMLSHYNLIANAFDCARALKISCRHTFICVLPLFHSFAATVCMNLPFSAGAKTVILKSVKPFKRVIRSIRKNRINIFVGIPSMYTVLNNIKLPRIFHTPLIKLFNPVKLCVSGAAALAVDTFKQFEAKFRIPLIEGYGLTEASPVVTLNPIKGLRKPGSIGLSMSENIQLKVVDDKDNTLEPGQIGELLVKGPNVMRGYFRQPEESQKALKNGWLYTGDMAKFDRSGYIYIVGRKKEMINVRGLNVYPREIEEVLYQNPKVKEAAVIGIEDPHRGEVPKGFVVLKDNTEATSHEFLQYLRQRLAAYKIPKTIELRESLPKNSTGKILKRLLKNEEKQPD